MKFFIKTFGCQQNKADSERIIGNFKARGMIKTQTYTDAQYVVINTCMVRESAENRAYGFVHNLGEIKKEKGKRGEMFKIIVTGCMVGLAFQDVTGKYLEKIRRAMPDVDEFMPIEEVGFDNQPIRQDETNAWVPISNGCNNFCTFCVVPFTRGREISRPFEDIIRECLALKAKGYKTVTLLGQNVNSYGADLIMGEKNINEKTYFQKKDIKHLKFDVRKKGKSKNTASFSSIQYQLSHTNIKPTYVKHLGRYRIPTLFPHLIQEVAQIGFEKVDFMSSNPWDFSDELIDVIAKHNNITRTIHLPVQSGDDAVLQKMNRWYTHHEYLNLIAKLQHTINNVQYTTDIIVGFCGETDEQFENTVKLCEKVGFEKAYISMYSQRPTTAATKVFEDTVPHQVKKKRWQILENLINKPRLIKYKKQ